MQASLSERRLTSDADTLRAGALGALVVSLAGCGGSSGDEAAQATLERKADYWAITQIQKNFHEATSKKDIALMMSLYAPNATLTIPGQTAVGKEQIRRFWLTKSDAFRPSNRWVSETPAYKMRVTADGDGGTLHFECHYVDIGQDGGRVPDRRSGGRADQREVDDHRHGRRISSAHALRLSVDPASERGAAGLEARRRLSRGDNVAVRAVGRLPAKFIPSCSSPSWALRFWSSRWAFSGCASSRSPNDRVAALGALQDEPQPTASSRRDTRQIRLLLAENPDPDFYTVWPRGLPRGRTASAVAIDLAVLSALARIGPATLPDELGFVPPAEDERVLRKIG